ncbi:uncharacterized protein MONBRDRAFT_22298 [Monosiga brevicollis MX1]|uniref:Major facilitator superfamily (MFS) profile domain-containing protein n=1 Tax=Monosiga brevicollis TaxID=81824 RepID=A9UQ59_MONBE|nr:uncharacterized protein MONBRDRAFT_22298 [Monosiga brevicollis MX1]EDQ92538.1 predicted protein [Monosiga brevicollis MX1]|eukprot:XP_001742300.1 hypothetical protein [Monosiga brevicollis MX1]
MDKGIFSLSHCARSLSLSLSVRAFFLLPGASLVLGDLDPSSYSLSLSLSLSPALDLSRGGGRSDGNVKRPGGVCVQCVCVCVEMAGLDVRTVGAILALISFLDMTAVGMLIPLLPRLYSSHQASASAIGFMGSLYGTANLVGGPIFGFLGDAIGPRAALTVAMVGSAVGYALLGTADSLAVMGLARVITGCFKQTLTVAKSTLAVITPPATRARDLGRIGSAASAGFIIGPLIGGFVFHDVERVRLAAMLTAGVFAINALLAWGALRALHDLLAAHHRTLETEEPTATSSPASQGNQTETSEQFKISPSNGPLTAYDHARLQFESMVDMFKVVMASGQWRLVAAQLGANMAMVTLRSVFATFAEQEFAPSPHVLGLMLSAQGAMGIVFGLCVGPVVRLFGSESAVFLPSLLVQGLSYCFVFYTWSPMTMTLASAPLRLGNSVMAAVGLSMVSQAVTPKQRGAVVSSTEVVMSLSRTVSPFLAGLALDYGRHALALFCLLQLAAGCLFLLARTSQHIRPKTD